jgi:hypothetical protein
MWYYLELGLQQALDVADLAGGHSVAKRQYLSKRARRQL